MTWRILVALALGCLSTVPAHAQTWSQVWARTEVKKRFNGGRDEQEAAQVALVAPDGWSSRYFLVDTAVRLNAPPIQRRNIFLFLGPMVEYHHIDAEALRKQKAVHQISPGFTVDTFYTPDFIVRPYVSFKAAATRNLVDDTTERSISVFATTRTLKNFAPGQASTIRGKRVLRYVPSVGYEYYDNLAITSGSAILAEPFTGSFTSVRLFVQAYPFNHRTNDDIRFAIEADGYVRSRRSGAAVVPKTMTSFSASATWYFLSKQRLGLGFSGDFGRMPSTNFVTQRRVVLAFRVKLAPM